MQTARSCPEGTKIQVSVYAIPEYNWDRSTGKVIGQLGEGASWVTTMTVDNTAPVVPGRFHHPRPGDRKSNAACHGAG